jgi:hypothetical protein
MSMWAPVRQEDGLTVRLTRGSGFILSSKVGLAQSDENLYLNKWPLRCSYVHSIIWVSHRLLIQLLSTYPSRALLSFVLRLFASKSLAKLHKSFVCVHFRINALWLAAWYQADPLYLIGIPFSIYTLFICLYFFQKRNYDVIQCLGCI